jgi:tetratricopeptide (TPR) repeat protein
MNLGLYDEASSLLTKSVPAINRSGTEGAVALATLGETYHRQGKNVLARRTLDRAERLLTSTGADTTGPGKVASARIALAIARVERADGKYDAALARLDGALRALGPDTPARPIDRGRLRHTRGLVLLDQGRYADAASSLEAAHDIYVEELGLRHRLVGENLYDQAQNAYVAGDLPKALRLVGESQAILGAILDPDNPFRAHVLALKGQILFGDGQLRPARAALDQAVATYRKAYGGPNYVIGISQVYLALIAADQGETAAALAYLDEAKFNYDQSYGELHPNHGDLLVNRATILAKAGRTAEARANCIEGLAILGETLGRDHPFTVSSRESCTKAVGPAGP